MQSQAEIVDHIRSAVEEVTLGERAAASVQPAHTLLVDLDLDSLDYATVVLICEERLGVKVPEEGVEWEKLDSVEALAGFLHAAQSNGSA
jgi:acyl carrier protein